jgi:hypothetical protein
VVAEEDVVVIAAEDVAEEVREVALEQEQLLLQKAKKSPFNLLLIL